MYKNDRNYFPLFWRKVINILKHNEILTRNGKNQIIHFFKKLVSSVLTVHYLHNGDTIINHYDTANTFNNYFGSTAETTKSKDQVYTKTFFKLS